MNRAWKGQAGKVREQRALRAPRLAAMAGVLGLAASLAALDVLARPALARAEAWIEEDRDATPPSPLELGDVRWTLEGTDGAHATLGARRLELAAPRIGALALNARRRPLLFDVQLALMGGSGERTQVHAMRARVETDEVVLEGRVVARGPGDRELRASKLTWRRDEGALIAEGPLSHTGDGRRPIVQRDLKTDLALGTKEKGHGARHEHENQHEDHHLHAHSDDELAVHTGSGPALPARGARAAGGGGLQQQQQR